MSLTAFYVHVSSSLVASHILNRASLPYLRRFRRLRVLGEVPQELPQPPDPRVPEVLLHLPPLLLQPGHLLPLDLLEAELDLGVVLEGAARLQQQLVDAPVLELGLCDEGAHAASQMQGAGPVHAEDRVEADPGHVEKVF